MLTYRPLRGANRRPVSPEVAAGWHRTGESYVVSRALDGDIEERLEVHPQARAIDLLVFEGGVQTWTYVLGEHEGVFFVEEIRWRPLGKVTTLAKLYRDGSAEVTLDVGDSDRCRVGVATVSWPEAGEFNEIFALPRDVRAFLHA